MKRVLLSTITAVALMGNMGYAKEKAPENATVKQVKNTAVKNAKSDAVTGQKKLVEEALDSLKASHEALMALKKEDKAQALKEIEKALGKLEVILSAKEAPTLLPIKSLVTVNEFVGTSDDVKSAIKLTKTLLDSGKVQLARKILSPLQSEIDITTVSLPLVSYPDALKLAATYIHSDKIEMAKEVLTIALNTFDEVTVVVPIPLLKATDLIAAASDIAVKDKAKAIVYLEAASESLKVAKELGYVSKSATTYKVLQDKIDEVKKEVNGKNKAEKLFDSLKEKLEDFKKKLFTPEK
jgi:hypothetical protein